MKPSCLVDPDCPDSHLDPFLRRRTGPSRSADQQDREHLSALLSLLGNAGRPELIGAARRALAG